MDRRIQSVLDFMEKHYSSSLSLERLAQEAGCSKYHFSRLFSKELGVTPMAHLTGVRLKQAFHLLVNSDRTVTDIAMEAGFDSPSGFYQAFEKRYKITPGTLRKDICRNTVNIQSNMGEDILQEEIYSDSTNSFLRKVWTMNVVVKDFPSQRLAYVRRVGSYLDKEQEHWGKLVQWSGKQGLYPPKNQFLGMSLDNPALVPEEQCRHDACVVIPQDFPEEEHQDISFKSLEPGLYGVYSFYDVVEKLPITYRSLFADWLPLSGFELDGRPSLEINLNNPKFDVEGKCRVDICIPVKHKTSSE